MGFTFTETKIPGVVLVQPDVYGDDRGFFTETYRLSEFRKEGIDKTFVQDNHSRSQKDVLRGLHYQLNPKAQGKLIRVTAGEVFDIAVDIRRSSPTYGRWVGETLSADNNKILYIPEGFAHGFCVISDSAEVVYSCTEEYTPELDKGILWNDPAIGIDWPLSDPVISEKDANLPLLADAENNFNYENY